MSRIAIAVAALCALSCKVKIGGEGDVPGDFPCEASEQCPAAESPCLLSTCLDGQCAYVPAPDGQLPEEDQRQGDCKIVYCDGEGEADVQPAGIDVPADDGNPCTDAVCDVTTPKHLARAAGSRCQNNGMCNGAGKCGVCVPKSVQCSAERGETAGAQTCSADGQWSAPALCGNAPRCAAGKCLAIVELDLGRAHGCTRFEDGAVYCWGSDDIGQLGSGERAEVWLSSAFTRVALGTGHGCGIRHDASVWCWGAGDRGQLGTGNFASQESPVATGLSGASDVAVGAEHSCALVGGKVYCWGRNDLGQSGKLAGRPQPVERDAPSAGLGHGLPEAIAGATAQDLTLIGNATCIRSGSATACWGWQDFSLPEPIEPPEGEQPTPEQKKLLRERQKTSVVKPQEVAGVKDVVQIGAGLDHSCALGRDGSVICWGAGESRQLGGDAAVAKAPTAVAGIAGAKQLVVGRRFACALVGSDVWCWGANDLGQLGTGSSDASSGASKIAALPPVTQLEAGDDFVCAIANDKRISCWGDSSAGQLGHEGASSSSVPLPLPW